MEKQSSSLINGGGTKVKLLCSYGGRIQSRPTDHQLSYIGGDTKILAVDRGIKFSEIASKLISMCEKSEVSIKYQFPGEDLDALVSLLDDEDVEHMMVEYDRLQRIMTKPVRLRLFVFDVSVRSVKPAEAKDSGQVTPSNPDYLFGFDKEYQPSVGPHQDLLQIPVMIRPDNYGLVQCGVAEGKIGNTRSGGDHHGSVDRAEVAPQAVYWVPAVVNGGIYQAGLHAGIGPAMGGGNRDEPEQMMLVPAGNNPDLKVNRRNLPY